MKAILKMGVRELDLVTNYTGHPYDPVLGVYYTKARMYDATDRRWLSPDPNKGDAIISQSLNMWVYVLNNPLKYVDPLGMKYSLVEGLTAHLMISAYVKMQYKTASVGSYISGVIHNKSGRGFADIIWKNQLTGNYEVYEIKSVEYQKGLYSGAALAQLTSYLVGINSNPNSRYRPAVAGISMVGLNNIYLNYPLNPAKLIKVTTNYRAFPGMIYYEIVEKKNQKVELVNLTIAETDRIDYYKKMACELVESVYPIDTDYDIEFFNDMAEWLGGVERRFWTTRYYVFESITFPDGTVLYRLVGNRFLFFEDPVPRVSYSTVEMMNILVGSNPSLTGKFTDYANTNWDPLGRQAAYDLLQALWWADWTIPVPGLVPVLPIPGWELIW